MSALSTRDALARALMALEYDREGDPPQWIMDRTDALLASGAVVDAATLADDEALVDRVCELMGLDPEFGLMDIAHVLSKTAAALTERGA